MPLAGNLYLNFISFFPKAHSLTPVFRLENKKTIQNEQEQVSNPRSILLWLL
jgi:hypothetical protein